VDAGAEAVVLKAEVQKEVGNGRGEGVGARGVRGRRRGGVAERGALELERGGNVGAEGVAPRREGRSSGAGGGAVVALQQGQNAKSDKPEAGES